MRRDGGPVREGGLGGGSRAGGCVRAADAGSVLRAAGKGVGSRGRTRGRLCNLMWRGSRKSCGAGADAERSADGDTSYRKSSPQGHLAGLRARCN